jgi:hypothetical protein
MGSLKSIRAFQQALVENQPYWLNQVIEFFDFSIFAKFRDLNKYLVSYFFGEVLRKNGQFSQHRNFTLLKNY